MKNICITKSNKKLNKNLPEYSSEDMRFLNFDPKQSIYKFYYSVSKNIDILLVNSSTINSEILSFISDFHDSIKTIIYYDDNQSYDIDANVINILDYNSTLDIVGNKLPKFIINDKIYDNISIPKDKPYFITYFLDNNTFIPEKVNALLYPKTKLKIRMFNGENIKHYQNLGYINEKERMNILLESEIFLYNSNDYLCEAWMCRCKTVDLTNQSIDDPTAPLENPEFTTYNQIIQDFIL